MNNVGGNINRRKSEERRAGDIRIRFGIAIVWNLQGRRGSERLFRFMNLPRLLSSPLLPLSISSSHPPLSLCPPSALFPIHRSAGQVKLTVKRDSGDVRINSDLSLYTNPDAFVSYSCAKAAHVHRSFRSILVHSLQLNRSKKESI